MRNIVVGERVLELFVELKRIDSGRSVEREVVNERLEGAPKLADHGRLKELEEAYEEVGLGCSLVDAQLPRFTSDGGALSSSAATKPCHRIQTSAPKYHSIKVETFI